MAALDRRDDAAGRTVADRVTEELRARILEGRLGPGSGLNLDEIRKELEVSVSSVREAITRLMSVGLVELGAGRVYRVAPVSLDNLAEITALRHMLEPMALRHAVANGGLEWETEVTAAHYRLSRTERIAESQASIEAWEKAHNGFHFTLIKRCDRPVLLGILSMLQNMNDRYRRIFLETPAGRRDVVQGAQRQVAQEHADIAAAAVAHDADRAASLLAAHIERTGTALRHRLAERSTEGAA